MNLLINAIATIATQVITEIESRKERAEAVTALHDYCDRNGYRVTEIMHLEPIDFMRAVDSAAKDGKVIIKYKNFPVTYNRRGNKERTNWSRCGNVITVHSGKAGF